MAPRRPRGRPPLGQAPKQTIAFRIAPAVLEALRVDAQALGIGYQTLIHQVLAQWAADATRRRPAPPTVDAAPVSAAR